MYNETRTVRPARGRADYLYFGVVRGALHLFDCDTDASGRAFLSVSPSIVCWSTAHMAMVPYGVASLVICT